MRELNTNEVQAVSGACGPGMLDGLIEGAFALAGIGMLSAFALGIASVYALQYIKSSNP